MKKVLILMLVLGMTSLAGASYDMLATDQGGGNYGITVTSDGLDADAYWGLGIDSLGTLSDVAVGPGAPSLSGIWGDLGDGYVPLSYFPGVASGKWGYFGTGAGTTRDPGVYLTALGHVSSAPVVYLYSFNEPLTVITLEDTAVLPEPMTIALLGLGGLFLRRRK